MGHAQSRDCPHPCCGTFVRSLSAIEHAAPGDTFLGYLFFVDKRCDSVGARSANKWSTTQRKDHAEEERFFVQLERQKDMEILRDDMFENKY